MMATAAAAAQTGASEIRTAHIGVGSRGGGLLRQVLVQENVRVSAICDIDPGTRDEALSAASRHSARTVTEWRQIVDIKDIDAVIIATPCDLHADMAAAFLEAGKYVYCEKPLGITPEQVDRVLKAARRSKAFLQIGQQLRYFPTVRDAIAQIHGGLIGRVYVVKAHRHGSRSRPAAGAPPLTARQQTRADWYADVKHSGDLIVENSIHNIDVCNWIVNSRPASAYGHGKRYFPTPIPPGTQMMDGYSVEYIYDNDVHLDYSQLTFHPRQLRHLPSGQWYVIFGEKGSVHLTHDAAVLYDIHGDGEPRDILTESKKKAEELQARKQTDNAMEEFFACIREKRQPFADIKVAATAALTGILGREAIYRRRSMAWKELGVEV